MKAALTWLNDYLDRPTTLAEAQERLTAVGFPVEHFEEVGLASGGRDTQLEVEITSNRSDVLSHLGVAREIAAATGRAVGLPEIKLAEGGPPVETLTSVELAEPALCPVYTARVIRGVKVGPSPRWMVDRLEAAGLRSVNNVVDVTNFVLMEMGQPLHAFDLAKLGSRRIVVRRAKAGEKFAAIDGTKHELRDTMLVIADAEKAVALAGVMGGLDSEVSAATTDVLLESAVFDPLSVRRTSRALKLASDSSYRYERGVDPRGIEVASRRAAALIAELAGGTVAAGVIRKGEPEPGERKVEMRVARCAAMLGIDLDAKAQASLLERLGLRPQIAGGTIACTIPTYRRDLEREVDLIEEVGRLRGYDDMPVGERLAIRVQPRQPVVAARQVVRTVLVAHGYHEAVTFSFVPPKHGEPFVPGGAAAVMIDDERRKGEPMLRPSVLPSLLAVRKVNQDAGNEGVRLFELASTWIKQGDDIREAVRLALLADATDAQAAVREIKGAVAELVERLGGEVPRFAPSDNPRYAAAASVTLGGQLIGECGLVAPAVRDRFDVKTPAVAAELDLQPLLALYPPRRKVAPLPRFPGIDRDLSVVVGDTTAWSAIESAVRDAKPALLETVGFLGTYRGKPIEKGRKSVSFRMRFRDPSRTLRHEEVDPQVGTVVAALKERVGAELRA